MHRKFVAALAVGLIGMSGQAVAMDASVAATKGSVLVNQNGRYAPVTSGTQLRAGDRIVALKGGQAGLTYADGCRVSLNSGSMMTVSGASPCAATDGGLVRVGETNGAAMGLRGGGPNLLLTFLILATTVGIVMAGTDDDEPVSP